MAGVQWYLQGRVRLGGEAKIRALDQGAAPPLNVMKKHIVYTWAILVGLYILGCFAGDCIYMVFSLDFFKASWYTGG
jgi:hypothetical protein